MRLQTSLVRRRQWTSIHNWVYWIDGPRLEDIAQSRFELAVIDYSADASARREFTRKQIDDLKHSGCERRVIAYLSVGEAERHRYYWQPTWGPGDPEWIVSEEPGWAGDHRIHYWNPAWRRVVFEYLDKILAQGFDGVFLDWVITYEEPHAAGHEHDMVNLVLDIARYARKRSPLGEDFGVVVQNAEELGTRYPEYLKAVTGIAREEAYVRATNRPTTPEERLAIESHLDRFRQSSRGGLVLTVDYADKRSLVNDAYSRARIKDYVPYVTDVRLNKMRVNHGYEPVCSIS
jgi:cysteinyl-tRNA synthetase, unknown class